MKYKHQNRVSWNGDTKEYIKTKKHTSPMSFIACLLSWCKMMMLPASIIILPNCLSGVLCCKKLTSPPLLLMYPGLSLDFDIYMDQYVNYKSEFKIKWIILKNKWKKSDTLWRQNVETTSIYWFWSWDPNRRKILLIYMYWYGWTYLKIWM